MIRILAILSMMFALSVGVAAASDVTLVVAQGPQTGKQFTGPGHVTFFGINPLKYSIAVSSATVWASPAPATSIIPTGSSVSSADLAEVRQRSQVRSQPTPTPTPTPIDAQLDAAQSALDNGKAEIGAVASQIPSAVASIDNILLSEGASGTPNATDAVKQINANLGPVYAAFADLGPTSQVLSNQNANLIKLKSNPAVTKDQQSRLYDLLNQFQNETGDISGLETSYGILNRQVEPSDVYATAGDTCQGLQGGSSVDTITLTLAPIAPPKLQSVPAITIAGLPSTNQVSTFAINCLGSIALSGGYIFSTLPTRSYAAQATNAAAGVTTPAATVQESSSITVLPTAFVHFAPWGCGETCAFITFGTTISNSSSSSGSSSTGTSVNFSLGASVSVYRYAFLTLGANLGQVVSPAGGYSVGSPIAAGAQVPTTSKGQVGLFFGISFGGSPGGTTQKTTPVATTSTTTPQ